MDVAFERALPGGAIDQLRPNHNLLDNGTMLVNQRTKQVYTSNGYSLDRWKLIDSGGISTVTVAEDTVTFAVPAQSPDQAWFAQYAEHNFDGRTYTASADAINVSGTVTLYMGTNLVGVAVVSVGIAAISGIPTGNLKALIAVQPGGSITLPRGKTAIKLELGAVSTLNNDPPADLRADFEECQRYAFAPTYRSDPWAVLGSGVAYSDTAVSVFIPTPVSMRSRPVASGGNSGFVLRGNGQSVPVTAITCNQLSQNGVSLVCTGTGLVANQTYVLSRDSSADGTLLLSADL